METSGVIIPKFMKVLTNGDVNSDYMKIPSIYVRKYGHLLQTNFLLQFRSGYELPVLLDRDECVVYGVASIFHDFALAAGQILVFEFDGSKHFKVYVIGNDLLEIDYPFVVHQLQISRPRVVSVRNGGLKFVQFIKEENPLLDEIEPPLLFKNVCPLVPGYQNYIFSNGKQTEGVYRHDSGRFRGLSKICSIVGYPDFRHFNLLLFSYSVEGVSTISFFDDHFVEVILPGTPMSTGLNDHKPKLRTRIEITIQPCHMYQYSYGVDISTEYENTTVFWKTTDYISVYSGKKAWKLQVKSRGIKRRRTTINDGWLQFRTDLGLRVGDVLVLECAENSINHFAVQVLRIDDA